MWTIRQEQTETFRQQHLKEFEDEMVEHSKQVAPLLSKLIGDEHVRLMVQTGIEQAYQYGFRNRGPIRLFLELKLLFGSSFDSDPQYSWAAQHLRRTDHEMARADDLRRKTLDYQANVSGPDAVNTYEALKKLAILANHPLQFSGQDYVPGILREMGRIFPQKASYVGKPGLEALLKGAMVEARRQGFPAPRGDLLVTSLMFAFGHGCATDPLYPWIGRTLVDKKIKSPEARAERLEKKALTWLAHVLDMSLEEHRNGS